MLVIAAPQPSMSTQRIERHGNHTADYPRACGHRGMISLTTTVSGEPGPAESACKRAGGFDSRPPPLPGLFASSRPRSEESRGLHQTEKPVGVTERKRPRGTCPDLAAVLCSSGPTGSYAAPRLRVKGHERSDRGSSLLRSRGFSLGA